MTNPSKEEREAIKAEVLQECIAEAHEMFPDLRTWMRPHEKTRPMITDHAVLRYLERVKGIDVEAVKREMDTPSLRAAVGIGASGLRLSNGAKLVIDGGSVVTVLPAGHHITRRTFERNEHHKGQ